MKATTSPADTTAISIQIVEAVAAVTDTDPIELDTPLYDVIDTDALDRLAEQDALRRVEFRYEDHTVAVGGDETITVDGRTVTSVES